MTARRRISGVLLHPTSLPGPYGIGDLGDAAYRFVDFLASSEQSVWQVLPLGPTGFGDSPYQSFSAFAGNPLLVSLDLLRIDGLLTPDDRVDGASFSEHVVDFAAVRDMHWQLLRCAFSRFQHDAPQSLRVQFEAFRRTQSFWLDDYTLFVAIKEAHDNVAWNKWPSELTQRDAVALEKWRMKLADEVELQAFVQFVFAHQWSALKAYANQNGVQIFGDIPIFVAHDSADVWAHPELFHLDKEGSPTVVAGVPPDYFSATGQLWGNPLYRWDRMQADNYAWWMQRFENALQQVDLVRLDHFRGFEAFWEIPATEKTAVKGHWVQGPSKAFFEAVQQRFGSLPIVAEDLGLITKEVKELRLAFDIPGMAVLHFAFGGGADNEYLPHNLRPECVLYTGTHDNDTTCGWYDTLPQQARQHVCSYLGCDGQDIAWDFVRAALRSVADMVIVPAQDLLSLGGAARMNKPARESGNWSWRLREGSLDESVQERLLDLTRLFGRSPSTVRNG